MQNYDQLSPNAKNKNKKNQKNPYNHGLIAHRTQGVETILTLDLRVQAWNILQFTSYLCL